MQYQDGLTLMHEHMTIDLSEGDLGTDSFEALADDLRLVYEHGVRNIVDLTNQTMGTYFTLHKGSIRKAP